MAKERDEIRRRVEMVNRSMEIFATAVEDQWAVLRFLSYVAPNRDDVVTPPAPHEVSGGVVAVLRLLESHCIYLREHVVPELHDGVEELVEVVDIEYERLLRAKRPKPVE